MRIYFIIFLLLVLLLILTACPEPLDQRASIAYKPGEAGVKVLQNIDLTGLIPPSESSIRMAKNDKYFYFLCDRTILTVNEETMQLENTITIDLSDDLLIGESDFEYFYSFELLHHDNRLVTSHYMYNAVEYTIVDRTTKLLSMDTSGNDRKMITFEGVDWVGEMGYNDTLGKIWVLGSLNEGSTFKMFTYDTSTDIYHFDSEIYGLYFSRFDFEGDTIWYEEYINPIDATYLKKVRYDNSDHELGEIYINYLDTYGFHDFFIDDGNIWLLYSNHKNRYGLYKLLPL